MNAPAITSPFRSPTASGQPFAPRAARSSRRALLLAVVATTALLQACGRHDERTVGQKVDGAVDRAGHRGSEVKADATQAARDVGPATGNASDQVPSQARDTAITAEVKARLAGDAPLSALPIHVDTDDGRVVLRGTAPETALRRRASDLARAVDGVTSVDNELSVQAR